MARPIEVILTNDTLTLKQSSSEEKDKKTNTNAK